MPSLFLLVNTVNLNPLNLGPFCKKRVFRTFWRFSGWIKLALIWSNMHLHVTRQLAVLANSIAFYDILAWACAEIKILEKVTCVFRLFDF